MSRLKHYVFAEDEPSAPVTPPALPLPTPAPPAPGAPPIAQTTSPAPNQAPPAPTEQGTPKPKSNQLDQAKEYITGILSAANNVAESYVVLFQSLTTLSQRYPQLYHDLELVARFPNASQSQQVNQMRDNLEEISHLYLNDDAYLSQALGLQTPGLRPPTPNMLHQPPVPPNSAQPPRSPDAQNTGDDKGLPDFTGPSKYTPSMSPSSKQPFSDVFRSSSVQRLKHR